MRVHRPSPTRPEADPGAIPSIVPELPEVETLRRGLEPLLCGRVVARATLHRRDVAVGPDDPAGGFARQRTPVRPSRLAPAQLLQNAHLHAMERRGKALAIIADDGRTVGVHLGMSGQLLWAPSRGPLPTTHVHATWRLADGSRLVFRDPRRFGGLWIADSPEALPIWAGLGPDALSLDPTHMPEMLAAVRRPIKAALLDQAVLAGVGNIYADEALHRAGIHPQRPARAVKAQQAVALGRAIVSVLCEAIEAGGSTVRDYRNATGHEGGYQFRHKVYGRGGGACTTCGSELERGVVAQRTSVWCPKCQPGPSTNELSTKARSGDNQKAGRSPSPRYSIK